MVLERFGSREGIFAAWCVGGSFGLLLETGAAGMDRFKSLDTRRPVSVLRDAQRHTSSLV